MVNGTEIAVQAVSSINTNTVEVTFPALAEAKTGATVTVKDSNGTVVAVKATDIAAGATFAQFDFVTPVTTASLTGVWSVNGVDYSFTAIKQLADITAAAALPDQVALSNALAAANINNVKPELIATYVTNISTANPAPASLADIQKIVDAANVAALDGDAQAAVVKTVADAKTQLALYTALSSNFARVNSAWAVDYASGVDAGAAGFIINAAPTANEVVTTAGAAKAALTYTDIQTAIDTVNAAKISAADTAADTTTKQADVTALIRNWTKDDVAPATTKVDAIKASQVKEAVLRVKEATTQNSVYSALLNLANVDATTLKASELNTNLVSFYFTEQQNSATQTALAAKTVAAAKTSIVTAADTAALTAAMTDLTAKYTALNADATNATKKADLKASLQKLANYTSHKTGTSKFDMSIVNDANLVDYSTQFAASTAISATSTVADVVSKITTVNSAATLNTSLTTINDTNSTATQVKNALTEIAVAANLTGFVNLSAQAQLEVAQLVIDARPAAPGYADLAAINTASSGAIDTQVAAHAAKLGEFNAIGDLASATTSSIKTALDTYAYDNYVALTSTQKVAVAAEIGKLTKMAGSPQVATPLNFSGADAVKTIAQANAIIDAAIAATK